MTALVTKHLPLVAGAPDGIRKLRALILDLALQGRLVAQNAQDAPASLLLENVSLLRSEFYQTGTARTPRIAEAVEADERSFTLPEGWTWTRLGFIAHPQAGFAFKSTGFNEAGRGLPLIRIRDVGQVFSGTYFDGDFRPEFVVTNGDYLVSMDGEFRVARWHGPNALLNQRVTRLQFFDCRIEKTFISYALQAALRGLQGKKAYTTVDHLSGGQISNAVMGLPPLAEQHRIVAKVDELMALCDRLEADQADAEAAHAQLVQALLDSLTQATDAADFRACWQRLSEHFHTLFTTEASIDALKQTVLQLAVMGKLVSQCGTDDNVEELLTAIKSKKAALHKDRLISKPRSYVDASELDPPFDIPSAWRWARLGELGITSTGSTPPTSRPECFGGTTPFIGPGQIDINGQISFGDKSLSEVGLAASTVTTPGDILMVCIGGSIGKSAMAQARIAFNQQINSISVLLANSGYVNLAMMSPYFRGQVLAAATGSATPIISRTKWEDICIPVPPLLEQHRMVAKVDELMALCDQLKAGLSECRQLHGQLATALVEQAVA